MERQTLICPFDESHEIAFNRMQFHIVKCAKNHSMIGKKKCPFNPLHIMKESDFVNHCRNCPNSATVEVQAYTCGVPKCFAGTISPDEYQEQLDKNLGPADNSWEENYAIEGSGYNPEYISISRPVYRTAMGESKSKRKQFRKNERLRFANL